MYNLICGLGMLAVVFGCFLLTVEKRIGGSGLVVLLGFSLIAYGSHGIGFENGKGLLKNPRDLMPGTVYKVIPMPKTMALQTNGKTYIVDPTEIPVDKLKDMTVGRELIQKEGGEIYFK